MERLSVKSYVDQHIESLMQTLGIPHWHITVEYNRIIDDRVREGYFAQARCNRNPAYNKAVITIDPDQVENEEELSAALTHELLHVVLSPFDLHREVLLAGLPEDGPDRVQEALLWNHVVEKAVINLNRMRLGLTGRQGSGERHAKAKPKAVPKRRGR